MLLLLTSCSDLLFPHFEPCVCSCYMAYLSKPQAADTSAFFPEFTQHPALCIATFTAGFGVRRKQAGGAVHTGPCTWCTVPLSREAAVDPATGHCCRDSIPLGFSPPPCTLTPSPSCLFLCPPSPHFHPSHTHTCFPS